MNIKKRLTYYVDTFRNHAFFSRLLRNMTISFIGEGGAAVLGLLTTIVLIRTIGSPAYGVIMVAYSFITIIDNIVNFQSWQGVITFGSKAMEEKDYTKMEKIIKAGSIIDFSTAILGTIVTLVLAALWAKLMGWNHETVQCIYIMAFITMLNFTGTSIGVLRLLNKFKYYSIFRIVHAALKLVAVFIACSVLDTGIIGAAFAHLIGESIGYLFLWVTFLYILKKDKRLSLRRSLATSVRGIWRPFFKFTFWTNMSSTVDVPVQQFDVMFLSLISYEVVAVFKVYKQIGQALSKLATPLNQAILPQFSELITKGKLRDCYTYLIKLKRWSMKILMPTVLLTTLVSVIFMQYILDPIYVEYWYILLLYLLSRAFALSYTSIHPLFVALGQVRKNFMITLMANIIYIVIASAFIRYMGIWAIILALFTEYVVMVFSKQYFIKKQCLN